MNSCEHSENERDANTCIQLYTRVRLCLISFYIYGRKKIEDTAADGLHECYIYFAIIANGRNLLAQDLSLEMTAKIIYRRNQISDIRSLINTDSIYRIRISVFTHNISCGFSIVNFCETLTKYLVLIFFFFLDRSIIVAGQFFPNNSFSPLSPAFCSLSRR